MPQGTLSLQAARAWRFLCQNSAGGREETKFRLGDSKHLGDGLGVKTVRE